MIKVLIDLLGFLRTTAPLITSLAIFTLLFILLAKSIKKHSTIYYIAFSIPFILIAVPFVCRLFGIEIMSFTRIPILGEIVRDYIHMGTFGHPLLIIIMYMGALNLKIPYVKKLMSIRKELSIISGFAVFSHSIIRVSNNFPNSLKFFTNNTEYMANTRVASELGAGISNFSFVLGIVMLVIFIPLWVTSFDSVRKRMGYVKWKKLQKWSYVLYATLFIHAMGIQIGGLMNPRGGNAPKPAAVESTIVQSNIKTGNDGQRTHEVNSRETSGNDGTVNVKESTKTNNQVARPAKGFSDIKVNSKAKGYIHIISLILIYGSYLFLRLRKAKNTEKKLQPVRY